MTRLPERPMVQSGYRATAYSSNNAGMGLILAGNKVRQAGEFIDKIEDQERDANTKLELAYADASFLQAQLKAEDEVKNLPYDKMEGEYNKRLAENLKTTASMIGDVGARKLFEGKAQSDIVRGTARIKDRAFGAAQDVSLANLQRQADDALAVWNTAPEEEGRRIKDSIIFSATANRDKGYLSHAQTYDFIKKTDEGFALSTFNKLTPQERIDRLTAYMAGGKQTVDPDKYADYIIDNFEGEKPVIDGNGAEAVYGINKQWNPEAFANGLPTRDQAKKIYVEKYFKANGIDKLPPEMQLIALDTVIQHGKGAELIKQANGDPQKLIELRRDYYKSLPDYEKNKGGWNARLDKLASTLPSSLERSLPQDKIEKLLDAAKADQKAAENQKEIDLIAQREADIETKLKNESSLMATISEGKTTAVEMTAKINEMDLKGQVRDGFAEEARRYISSVEKLNANTDPQEEAEILQRVYDVSAIADQNPKAFLEGLSNVQRDIMAKRADGKLSAESEAKLKKQITTITSAKKSGAASQIAYSFGDARKAIDKNLPPEYRLQAIRELNEYSLGLETSDEMATLKPDQKKAAIKKMYTAKANEIIDNIKKQRRNKAVQNISKAVGGVREGMIVRNPTTGERMQYKDGKWQKM